jgi:hypothetical protein
MGSFRRFEGTMSGKKPTPGRLVLYRTLLRTLPRAFRGEFGEEMVSFLRLRLETTPSLLGRTWILARAILDLIATATAERGTRRRREKLRSTTSRRDERPPEKKSMSWDELRQDLVYAFRTLRRSPAYTAVVLLTLGVGIALNTLVFSLMNPFLFRPLPYSDAQELVHLGGLDRLSGSRPNSYTITRNNPELSVTSPGTTTVASMSPVEWRRSRSPRLGSRETSFPSSA